MPDSHLPQGLGTCCSICLQHWFPWAGSFGVVSLSSFITSLAILLKAIPPVCISAKLLNCVQLFATPWTVAHRFLCPWDSPVKNTGVSCHAPFQGIFPSQGSKPHLLKSPALAGGFFTTRTTWEAQFPLPSLFFLTTKKICIYSLLSFSLVKNESSMRARVFSGLVSALTSAPRTLLGTQ